MPMDPTSLTLEIHHVDVKGGDATLILVKDKASGDVGAAALIDAGGEGRGSLRLKKYLENQLGDRPLDYLVASHYHNDHMDGFRICNQPFLKWVDLGGYTVQGQTFTPVNGNGLVRMAGYMDAYVTYIGRGLQQDTPAVREPIPFLRAGFQGKADPLRMELGTGTGVWLVCYAAGGVLANGQDVDYASDQAPNVNNEIRRQKAQRNLAVDPNDLSIAWVLEWEDFLYFTAGDLSGDTTGLSYYNVEQPLAEYLFGAGGPLDGKRITVLKTTHHGSERSTWGTDTDGFLSRARPDAVIVPCNITKKVPSPVFLSKTRKYCNTESAALLFLNEMWYWTGEPHYAELQQIAGLATIAGNLEHVTDADGTSYQVRNTGAVVVRRNSGGQPFTDDMEGANRSIWRPLGYQLVLKQTTPGVQGSMPRADGWIIRGVIQTWLTQSIASGMDGQTAAIVSWIQQDAATQGQAGRDWVAENFPALLAAVDTAQQTGKMDELPGALRMRMEMLFTSYYVVDPNDGTILAARPPALTLDERHTLVRLLCWNRYQETLNTYGWGIKAKDFKAGTWNAREPYEPEPQADRPVNVRPEKRQKVAVNNNK
jgi:beta-lactamase superfamily II metal-dependent hydrolase